MPAGTCYASEQSPQRWPEGGRVDADGRRARALGGWAGMLTPTRQAPRQGALHPARLALAPWAPDCPSGLQPRTVAGGAEGRHHGRFPHQSVGPAAPPADSTKLGCHMQSFPNLCRTFQV